MSAWIGLIVLAVATLALVLSSDSGTIGGLEQYDFARLMTGVALLIFIGGGTLLSYRGKGTKMVKDIAIWLAVMLVLVTLYSFRNEFQMLGQRVAAELLPGMGPIETVAADGSHVVEIPVRTNGHYVTRVDVNNVPLEMLVDTGATDVALTSADAQRLGIDLSQLSYTTPMVTANGRTLAARIRLRHIAVGEIGANNVQATVAQPGQLDQSLLGMSFLSRLRSYEMRNGVLILRN